MSSPASPERLLAAFVREAAPPRPATDRAALALIDFTICALAGARSPAGGRILRVAAGPGAMTPEFVLAATGHVLDCDDNHDTVGGHPSCVLLPALLHGVRRPGLTVDDLLAPYVVGLETMAGVARSIGRGPYQRGWHTTCVYGAVGAAAALARANASGDEVTLAALGMAASFASGIKAGFGTDAKPLQVGHAALAGVLAHDLASAGCSAGAGALSGSQGLAAVLGEPHPQWDELGSLGARWETVDPGIVFKRFPCCASTHAPIEAVLALRRELSGEPRIDVTIHAGRLRHVDRPVLRTAVDAKFSLQFTVAAAWVDGRCTAEQFTPERLADPRIRDVMRRVTVRGATDLPWSATRVGCTTSGDSRELSIDAAVGHSPKSAPTLDDLSGKADSLGIDTTDLTEIRDLVVAGGTPVRRFVDALEMMVGGNIGVSGRKVRKEI